MISISLEWVRSTINRNLIQGRNNRFLPSFLAIFSMASLFVGCTANPVVSVHSIYQSQQCAVEKPQLVFLDSKSELDHFVKSSRRFMLNSDPVEVALPDGSRAVAVAWGNRPNAGYRLELSGVEASIAGSTLHLPVVFIEPEEGMMVSQVITSPCLIIGIDTREGYQKVQAGELAEPTP